MQTEDYARALMRGAVPPLSQDAIEKYVTTRLRRQEILTRADPPKFHAVVDEAAFHRLPGSPDMMAAQLNRIIDHSRLDSVTVQVLPFKTGPQPGSDSTFAILDYATPVLSSTVYVETLAGNLYLERETDLAVYQRVFSRLCELALSPEDTVSFLRDMLRTYSRLGVASRPSRGTR